jgi:hypothetical protein
MKYRIYIDEVGNPDLASSDNPNHRFLSLTGVILELGHVEAVVVLLERFVFFISRTNHQGDVMAESRGGKEDMRLKASFARLWEQGTDYVAPEQFQKALTRKQLKVKQKQNNISGLQLADLLAHPSRNEILHEQKLLGKDLAPFAKQVIEILQKKYDQRGGRIFGKKFL